MKIAERDNSSNKFASPPKATHTLWLYLVVLALALLLMWLPYLVRSNSFELPVLDNLHNPVQVAGLFDTEKNSAGQVLRWTGAETSVQLPSTLIPQQLTLDFLPIPKQTHVQLFYNGESIATFEGGPTTSYTLKIPTGWQWAGGTLMLRVSPTVPVNTANGLQQVGLALTGLQEIAAPTPPLTMGLAALLLTLSLLWAFAKLWPSGWPTWGYVAFVLAPVLILVLDWNFDRIQANPNLGWYTLVAIWLLLGLAFQPQLFPTRTPSASFGWYLNGGFLGSNRLFLKKNSHILVSLLPLVMVALAIWLQYNRLFTQSYGFYWDDYHIARPWDWGQLVGTFGSTWDPLHLEPEYYRPLTALSFALDYQLWGFQPTGYHLTNLLLEIGVVWLGYSLARKLGANSLIAALICLSLVTLPSSSDTVAWISERSDSLALLFMLLSLTAFAYFWSGLAEDKAKPNLGLYLATNIALLAALGSKETGVALPFLWVGWAWLYPPQSWHWRQLWVFGPPFVLTGLYLLLHTAVIHNPDQHPLTIENLWHGYSQAVSQTFYGLNELWNQTNAQNDADALITVLLLLLTVWLIGWQIYGRNKGRSFSPHWRLCRAGLGWVLITCLPLSLLGTTYGIDRRVLYAPSFGYALILGGVAWVAYDFIEKSVGSLRFWPCVVASLLGIWLVYNAFSQENLRNQRDYAPFATGSNGTLHWDSWILQQPEWIAKIPPQQLTFLRHKLGQ